MTIETAIIVEHDGWPDCRDLCLRAVDAALAAVRRTAPPGTVPDGDLDVSLVLSDDATVQDLNKTWRDQDRPTNVLSFPAYDPDQPDTPKGAPVLLGDIVLAFETCAAEAERDGIGLDDHLAHLVIHGFLHLLGYDHQTDTQADAMESLETAILAAMGIANPYKDDRPQDV